MYDNNIFYIRSGGTLPLIRATIIDNENEIVDLTNVSSVKFTMFNNDGKKIDESDGEVYDSENGQVTYQMSTADTDTVGAYNAYFKLVFQTGDIMYAPAVDTFDVEIVRT
jgi:hypothetical protein